MKQVRPLFDPTTHYQIDIEGRVELDWLQNYDSSAEIIVDESRITENKTMLNLHTDQSGIVGLVRRLHGLGMTIQRFQIITLKENKMTRQNRTFIRGALWMLPVWAALLFWATLTEQPDPLTAFADFAAYVTTSQFLFSHLLGSIVGAALGSIGVIGLMLYLWNTKVAGRAIAGMVATVSGNTLMSSTYGVAAFAQPAMGRLFQEGQQNAINFYNQTYATPLIVTALGGLLLFLVGGIFIGTAIAGSGHLPRWSGWVYAVMSVGFSLGLFFGSIVQTVTSVFLFVATIAVAWSAGRKDIGESAQVGMAPEI